MKQLTGYLEVLFLDANGVVNYSPRRESSFDLSRASLAIGVVNTTKQLIEQLDIDQFSVHKTFVAVNKPISLQLDTPLDPQSAWHDKVKDSIFE